MSVAGALFSNTQQRVLGLLFGQPGRRFTQRELIELAGSGSGAVQRELEALVSSGLVSVEPIIGRQRAFLANPSSPIFYELCGIIDKTVGIAARIRVALEPLEDRIRLAVLFGSVAAGRETAASDVDVLIVSDKLELEDILGALEPAEKALDRKVNPTLYTVAEFARRRRSAQPFLTKVFEREHVVLLGDKDAALASG